MEIHRNNSPKTVIILILTSVLSFAFVACNNPGKEKPDSYDSYDCIYGDAAACKNAKSAETYDKNNPFEAVFACDVEAMKSLLAKNPALVSARYIDYSQYKSNENTLLHYAVYCRNEMTKTLIDAGADVNAKTNMGITPLMNAVDNICVNVKGGICPNPKTTKILIDAGADVNAQGSLDFTPLTMAIHSSTNIDCVKLLIAAGANVKAHFERRKSLLYRAVEVKNPDLVRLLISSGAYYDEKALDYIRKEIYNKRNKGETPSSDMLLIRDILEDAQRR